MKRQQLFHSFLPGVTLAVLTVNPAWAANTRVHEVELDSSLDSTNLSHTVSTERHDQFFAQRLSLEKDTSIALSPTDWNTVTIRSDRIKSILSRVPKIKQISRERLSRIDSDTALYPANHSLAISDLSENLSSTKVKEDEAAGNQQRKPQYRSILNSAPIARIPTSKQKLQQTGTKQGQITDTKYTDSKQADTKQSFQRDSPSVSNVSQHTGRLTSSLQTNNCGASALLSNSAKCGRRININTSTRFSRLEPLSEKNPTKIRKPSLVKKLQTLKRIGDRKSNLEAATFESSSKTQLAQTSPEEATPPATEQTPQEATPPATEQSPQEAVPPTTEQSPQEAIPPAMEQSPQEAVPPTGEQTPQETTPQQPTQPPVDPSAAPPDYLNPNPNPLVFPSKPEEVRIKGTQPITLEQALELARRNNRQLQQALLVLKRSQAGVRQQQASLFPTLNLQTGLGRSQSAGNQLQNELAQRQTGQPTGSDEPGPTTFNGTVRLDYNLYTSGNRLAGIRAAEEQLKSDELDVERLSEEIRLDVSTDYYNLQQADESVRIQRSAVDNARAGLKDAEAQERAGIGTRFAVLQSRAQLANAIQNLNNALSAQIQRRSALVQRLSLPQSVNVAAADPVKLAGLWNKSLEDSFVLAFQNRPELQQQLAQRNINEQQRRQALSALGPQISLVGTYDLLDQFDDGVGITDGYSISLQGNLNLFDGGAARASAEQQKANIAIAENNFALTREQIRTQVEQAYAQLQFNLKNVETSNVGLEEAREALRLARLRFQAGVGTQTDVINQEDRLTQAEGNRVTAIVNYNLALAQLKRAVTSRGIASSDNPEGDAQSES